MTPSAGMIPRILDVCTNPSVRQAGQHVLATSALSPGVWLQELSDADLQQLLDDVHSETQLTCIELACIMLLGTGEVLEELDDVTLAMHVHYVRSLVTFESLHRKGALIFLRNNISFDLKFEGELVQRIHGEV